MTSAEVPARGKPCFGLVGGLRSGWAAKSGFPEAWFGGPGCHGGADWLAQARFVLSWRGSSGRVTRSLASSSLTFFEHVAQKLEGGLKVKEGGLKVEEVGFEVFFLFFIFG